jgi:hypothetical protein
MPRLFALDRNIPQPIVDVLSDFQIDATLVSLDRIDKRMSTLDDWELLLALHHYADPWDGLITTDSSMLAQGPELAALIQTKLTLVVAVAAGHNPVKASKLPGAVQVPLPLGCIGRSAEPAGRGWSFSPYGPEVLFIGAWAWSRSPHTHREPCWNCACVAR